MLNGQCLRLQSTDVSQDKQMEHHMNYRKTKCSTSFLGGLLKNRMELIRGKCKVFFLDSNGQLHEHMMGNNWLGSCSDIDLEGIDHKLNMSYQCYALCKRQISF